MPKNGCVPMGKYELGDRILNVLSQYDKGLRVRAIANRLNESPHRVTQICILDTRIERDFSRSWKPAEEADNGA